MFSVKNIICGKMIIGEIMIKIYEVVEKKIMNTENIKQKCWIDLVNPTPEEIKQVVRNLSGSVAIIVVEHGQKLEALFDAFKLHSEKIDDHNKRIIKCWL